MPIDPLTLAAVGSAGASIFGSIMGSRSTAQSTRETNQMNYDIARENRDWQERMDNTKYQRGVADARAAGFNPLVAFPGSAGTPIPATPTMQNPNQNKGELFASTGKALADIMLTHEMAKTERTKQKLNEAQASGSFGIPGVMSLPFATASNAINAIRNLRPDPSKKRGNRNMDTNTLLNVLKSGPMGIGN